MDLAQIGPSIRVKGEISAHEPLTIAGHVDGTIRVEGHALTVAPGAHVTATMFADSIDVEGTVNGNLSATVRIAVRETATIKGDLTAPSVSLADGAVVQGRVETAQRERATLRLAS